LRKVRFPGLIAAILLSGIAFADTPCNCDPERPETLKNRECSLCAEVERQPGTEFVFFVKDINPRKPNRMLAIPRTHQKGMHPLSELTAAQRTELWTLTIAKAKSLWGDDWGIAYNGDHVRTQCHTHVHIGKLLPGVETESFVVVSSPAEIPVPDGDGFWIHPIAGGKLHVHSGEQICETVLLR
jgi:diadenosine tetraphosphate (Ap4A) HIT family hydrolase